MNKGNLCTLLRDISHILIIGNKKIYTPHELAEIFEDKGKIEQNHRS